MKVAPAMVSRILACIARKRAEFDVVVALVTVGAIIESKWNIEYTAGKIAKRNGNLDIHKFFKSLRTSGKTTVASI